MFKKYFVKTFFLLCFIIIFIWIYTKYFKKEDVKELMIIDNTEDKIYNSNIIKDVNYTSKDLKGNEYIIDAIEGEIELTNSDVIFLKKVTTLIKMKKNSENIVITSDYGKYNTINYDTIFSKNVKVIYLDNTITGEYLDFSLARNSMIMTTNVVYDNLKNILKADVVEVNIETKDTKVFMHDMNKKVNIQNIN
jgi:lipopolysaccharide export system protein LptA|tara:strand:+ start:879 stop:1457 length:579 start_codon:yes stop_codon:yes gene_type:complete